MAVGVRTNLNGLADRVMSSYVVTNTGDVTLSSVSLVDDVEGCDERAGRTGRR